MLSKKILGLTTAIGIPAEQDRTQTKTCNSIG